MSTIISFKNATTHTINNSFSLSGAWPLIASLPSFSGGVLGTLYLFLDSITDTTTVTYKITLDANGNDTIVSSTFLPVSLNLGQDLTKGSVVLNINQLITEIPGKFELINNNLTLYLWLATDTGSVVGQSADLVFETYVVETYLR